MEKKYKEEIKAGISMRVEVEAAANKIAGLLPIVQKKDEDLYYCIEEQVQRLLMAVSVHDAKLKKLLPKHNTPSHEKTI